MRPEVMTSRRERLAEPSPAASRLRVIVAGWDGHVRAAHAAARQDARFELVGAVAHAAAAVSRTLEVGADLVVLDVDIPGDALAAAAEIHARLPTAGLVMTYGASDAEGFLAAIAAGASAYVERDGSAELLQDAMAAVGHGTTFLSGAQVGLLVDALRGGERPRRRLVKHPELTSREWQIFELMRRLSIAEIAEQLALSPVTVRSHTRAIRSKVGPVVRGPVRR